MLAAIVCNRNYPLVPNCPTVTEVCEINRFEIFGRIDCLFLPTFPAINGMENPTAMPDDPSVFGIRKVEVHKMGFPIRLASNLLFYTTDEQERGSKENRHPKARDVLKNLFHLFYLLVRGKYQITEIFAETS